MEAIGERVRCVRKREGLTMEKFGARIGISNPSVSTIESGKSNPSNQTIIAICREFGVNESWLRTGAGEMFPPRDEMDELMAMAGRFLSKELTDFQQRWARMLFSLTPEEWALLERKALELTGQDKEKTEEP